MTPWRVVIIGGGITGLSCALRLHDHILSSDCNAHITLLEASSRLGGKLRTDRLSGFIVDAGADIFLASKPDGIALCSRLGIQDQLIETDPVNRQTFVRTDGLLKPMPFYRNERLVTFPEGMQTLTDAIVGSLHSVEFRTNTSVAAVVNAGNCYELHTQHGVVHADAVVIALPARPAASLVRSLSREAASALSGVSYRTSVTVSVAFARSDVPHSLKGYGYLVPGARRGDVSACTWTSSKIPSRAPEGFALLRGFVHGGPGVTIARAKSLVLNELNATLGVSANPIFVRANTWRDGLPVTDLGRRSLSERIRGALATHTGCVLAGGAVDGAGIPDSIGSGTSAADQVWRHLNDKYYVTTI